MYYTSSIIQLQINFINRIRNGYFYDVQVLYNCNLSHYGETIKEEVLHVLKQQQKVKSNKSHDYIQYLQSIFHKSLHQQLYTAVSSSAEPAAGTSSSDNSISLLAAANKTCASSGASFAGYKKNMMQTGFFKKLEIIGTKNFIDMK